MELHRFEYFRPEMLNWKCFLKPFEALEFTLGDCAFNPLLVRGIGSEFCKTPILDFMDPLLCKPILLLILFESAISFSV